MATVSGSSSHNLALNLTTTLIGAPVIPAARNLTLKYTNGTGAQQFDLLYEAVLVLSAAATTIDLTSLTSLDGTAINFARVRGLFVENTSTTSNQKVTVSGGASNPWAPLFGAAGSITVWPGIASNGGVLVVEDPVTVGASNGLFVSGTSKTIKFDPGANTITANVIIWGGSAVS